MVVRWCQMARTLCLHSAFCLLHYRGDAMTPLCADHPICCALCAPRGSSTSSSRSWARSSCSALLSWLTQMYFGFGISGIRWPVLLGLLRHELCVLDRHQSRRHAHLRDSATRRCGLAAAGDPMRRGDHRVRADDRRDVSDHPSGASVAGVLAVSLSERTADLAQLPVAAGLGFLCDQHLPDRQRAVPVPADDSRLRRRPRQVHRAAATDLHAAGARLAWHAEAVASARDRDGDHGGRHRAGRGLRPHHRLVRLLDGAGADVAVDDLRSLLRGRRDLQRHRRTAHRHGGPAASPAPRALPAPDSLREPGQAAPRDGAAVGLLRLQRAARDLLRERAVGDGRVLADAARIVRTALLDDGDRATSCCRWC